MRWQSSGTGLTACTACMTGRPKVRFGTKCASMTSTCSQSASATRAVSSARRAKSADSRLGAIIGSRDTSAESRWPVITSRRGCSPPSYPPRMDLSAGIAVRVSALCLDPRGRLVDNLLADTAVRGGLLLDLALAGRLESEEESIVVDGTPTGFAPADRLLAAIAV